jgi:hypothetical protein
MARYYRTSEGELDLKVPTPSLHRDESVMHIPVATAQPEPLHNDHHQHQARKLIGLLQALEPGVKSGAYQARNSTGTYYTLPDYIAKTTETRPPSPIPNCFRVSPDSNPLALLPPTWSYRSPSCLRASVQTPGALSMPVRPAGETLLFRRDSGTRIDLAFDSGTVHVSRVASDGAWVTNLSS